MNVINLLPFVVRIFKTSDNGTLTLYTESGIPVKGRVSNEWRARGYTPAMGYDIPDPNSGITVIWNWEGVQLHQALHLPMDNILVPRMPMYKRPDGRSRGDTPWAWRVLADAWGHESTPLDLESLAGGQEVVKEMR